VILYAVSQATSALAEQDQALLRITVLVCIAREDYLAIPDHNKPSDLLIETDNIDAAS